MLKLFPVAMIVFSLCTFGWVYSIGAVLQEKLPENAKANIGNIKLFFLIPIVYLVAILFWVSYDSFTGDNGHGTSIGLVIIPLVIVHLLSVVCLFLAIRIAAKTMKSVELGRLTKFGEYVQEFFLIWFSPIGIWVLQPRLNKLTKS